MRRFDVTHFATAALRMKGHELELLPDPGTHMPAAWLQRYAERNFLQRDPVAWWNFRGSGALHSDHYLKTPLDSEQKAMFGEAAEHGFRSCVTVPAPQPDGRVRSFCLWTDRIDAKDTETMVAIRLVASAWLDSIEQKAMRGRAANGSHAHA